MEERVDGIPIQVRQRLESNESGKTSLLDGTNGQESNQTSDEQYRQTGFEIHRILVLPSVVQKVELDGEEDGQDGLQHLGDDPGVIEILESWPAVDPYDLGGRIEASNDNIRGESRQALDGGGTDQTTTLVGLQVFSDLAAIFDLGQLLGNHVSILNGLASALAQVL